MVVGRPEGAAVGADVIGEVVGPPVVGAAVGSGDPRMCANPLLPAALSFWQLGQPAVPPPPTVTTIWSVPAGIGTLLREMHEPRCPPPPDWMGTLSGAQPCRMPVAPLPAPAGTGVVPHVPSTCPAPKPGASEHERQPPSPPGADTESAVMPLTPRNAMLVAPPLPPGPPLFQHAPVPPPPPPPASAYSTVPQPGKTSKRPDAVNVSDRGCFEHHHAGQLYSQ